MQPVPDAAALVSLAVLRWLGGGGHGSDGQVDCCVCDRSGATLLWLRLADLVALVVRQRLGGCRAWILLRQTLGSCGGSSCRCVINAGRVSVTIKTYK